MTPSPPLPLAVPLHFGPIRRPPTPLPIDPQWRCQQSGECCTQPEAVVMTEAELQALRAYAARHPHLHGIQVEGYKRADGKMAMKAQPCPFYLFNTCQVYEVRPYNCRRFACMRVDVKAEPFRMGGPMGCLNLSDRLLQSEAAVKLYTYMQKKAQGWARKMGWES